MKRTIASTIVLTGALLAGGCATKKYVRNTTAPIQAKVDQVGEQTNHNTQGLEQTKNDLKQVDDKAQSGISAAQERASTADTHAQEAMNRANQAQQAINQTNQDVSNLRQTFSTTISNLDDYKLATELSVPFRFNRYNLTDDDRADLDKMANEAAKYKRFFITVEGFTDRTGSVAYNEALSRKRADAVAQYLVTAHEIPLYRIHMIGLGEQKPVDTEHTRAARAKNRRVELKLYTADQSTALSQLQQK